MADINALIAQGVNPVQIESPVNQFTKMQALRAAQQEQQLNALKLQETQRVMGQQEALRNYLAGATDTGSQEFLGGLTQFGESGLAIRKALSDAEAAALTLQKNEVELVDSKLKQSRQLLEGVSTPEDYLKWHLANHSDPVLGRVLAARGVTAEQSLARIQAAMAQPGGFERLLNESKLGVERFAELNKPILTSQDFSGGIRIVRTPGMGGPATVVPGSTVTKTLTADQLRAQELEGREVARTITDEFGNVILLNKFGQVIPPTAAAAPAAASTSTPTLRPVSEFQDQLAQSRAAPTAFQLAPTALAPRQVTSAPTVPAAAPAAAAGAGAPVTLRAAPSATVQKTQAQQKQLSKDLDTALFELKEASKDGGLIDQSTGSGVGRAVDFGARVFGSATEGDIAIGKLKPIADLVLKLVPRFEGPQSDKDTQSYREAAGQLADPGMPTKIRKEAAKTIIRLMENRKGQFVTNEMANQSVSAASGDVDTSNPLLK